MDSIWGQLRDLFEHDDGSLPEIELTNLGAAAIPGVFAALWRRGHDATAGGASYCDRRDGCDKPIASAEDGANAAVLVCKQEAEPIHVVLGGLGCADSPIPDLGVFVHPEGLVLDYRMGSAWGPQQVAALFALLFTIAEAEPDLAVHHQYSDQAFDVAWKQYREARNAVGRTVAMFRQKWIFPLGGLVAMGFAHSDRYLLVVTHSGRGVFEVATGARIARDLAVVYPESGTIDGLGPLQGDRIRVAEYDFENALVVVSESGRYRAIGASSELVVEEAT